MSHTDSPDPTSETEPLLQPQQTEDANIGPLKVSPVTLIFPVVLVYRLAMLLPSTTTFYMLKQFACRLWYVLHDPDAIPPGGLSDEQCAIPPVQRMFSGMLTFVAIMDGVGSVVGYSALSFFSSRHGRKPVMLAMLALASCYGASLVLSTLVPPGAPELALLALWLLALSLASPPVFGFLANMFVVDTTPAAARTAGMSAQSGWSILGGAVSFSLGGLITKRADNVLVVYCLSAGMLAALGAYVFFVVPESFTRDRREALRRQRAEAQRASGSSSWRRLVAPFEPLKQFRPARNPRTGRRNWRLFYCAVHIFAAQLADAYGAVSIVLYLTARFDYKPSETGYVLTTLSLVDVFTLTVVLPLLVRRVLRPFYLRPKPNGSTDTSDRLDVHIAVASWCVNAAAYVLLGAVHTRAAQIGAVVLLGFGSGGGPVARSLVVATVHPLKQGDALGAVEMVSSLGTLLSPVVMGSVMTATISTLPQVVFWVHGAIVVSAAMVLFLVRDSDRYQGPRDEPPQETSRSES